MQTGSSYRVFLFIVTSIALMLQLYVMAAVLLMRKQLKGQRFYIVSVTVIDMLFTIAFGYILVPEEAPGVSGLYVKGLAKELGNRGGRMAIAFTYFCAAAIFTNLNYNLIRRFLSGIKNTSFIVYFQQPVTHVLFFLLGFSICFAVGTMCFMCFVPSEMYVPFLKDWIFGDETHVEMKNGEVLLLVDNTNPRTLKITTAFLVLFLISGVLTFLLAFGIIKNKAPTIDGSVKGEKYPVLLISQLLTPIVFIVTPFSLWMLAPFLNTWQPGLNAGVVIISIYFVANALLMLLFIKLYGKIGGKTNKTADAISINL